jgi:alpha-maltose-1-phosphate synthase
MLCRTQPDLDLLPELPPNVRFLSSVPDESMSNLYDEHDVFVMPSLVEGFGMVYLEAMSRGLPIVTTENGGGPDIISDGREGFIVSVGDPSAIAAALQRYIDESGLVARMGEQASLRAQTFTWARFRAGIREAAAATQRAHAPQSKMLVHAQ